tara:strand:+ start:1893 stop:2222 length:330 start_codon:yes stop_codon:yes gene_type:complete
MAELSLTTSDTTTIRLVDNEDNTLLEAEIIYLDEMLSKAQKGVDLKEDDAIAKWLPLFKTAINERFGCEVSDTDAYFVAREAASVMWDLKKKFDSIPTLQPPTESTPSD